MTKYQKTILFILYFIASIACTSELMSRPLNILFVTGHFPSRSQTFIMNRIKGMIDLGHNVFIFSFSDEDGLSFSDEDKEIYHLHERTFYHHFPLHIVDCDIVMCEFGYHGSKIVEMRKIKEWLKNKKIVTSFRGSDLTAHLQQDVHRYDRLFEKGDHFLVVCDYFRPLLVDIGCDASKITVMHSAIDCSLFSFKERQLGHKYKGPFNLVSVCRLVEKKGLEYAIRAVALALKQHPTIHYTIVGDGPEYDTLKKLVKQLGIKKNVTFFGWGTQAQVATILDESHIFLLPSMRGDDGNEEGIPNSLKEAMARGLPVITTRHAGIPELVEDGLSGFLVDEKDVEALAEKIEWLITHADVWPHMGARGRKKIEQEYETVRINEKLELLLYKLMVN